MRRCPPTYRPPTPTSYLRPLLPSSFHPNNVSPATNNEVAPNEVELACIDLLARQENVIDQLVQPDERADDVGMLDGSLQIMTTFLEFSDKHCDDQKAIDLSARLAELADRVAILKKDLLSQTSWFASKKPAAELRQEYLELGDAIAKMSAIELAHHSTLFRAGTQQQKSFQESSVMFLKEFKARW